MRIRRKVWILRRAVQYQVWSRVGALKGGSRRVITQSKWPPPSFQCRFSSDSARKPECTAIEISNVVMGDETHTFWFITAAHTFVRDGNNPRTRDHPRGLRLPIASALHKFCPTRKGEKNGGNVKCVVYVGTCKNLVLDFRQNARDIVVSRLF